MLRQFECPIVAGVGGPLDARLRGHDGIGGHSRESGNPGDPFC